MRYSGKQRSVIVAGACVLAAVCVAICAACATFALAHTAQSEQPESNQAPSIQTLELDDKQGTFSQMLLDNTYESSEMIAQVPQSSEVSVFSLFQEAGSWSADSVNVASLQQAVDELGAKSAFLLIDMNTGRGIQYNSDEFLYAASSSKGWFALFLCQMVDQGNLSWEDTLYAYTDYPVNEQGVWGSDYCVGALLENVLLYSDNGAYESLREAYEWNGYGEWLEELGLDSQRYGVGNWYPEVTACDSVLLWMRLYDYLQEGGPHADWLRSCLENTEVSFLREALESEFAQVAVMNKAGWDSGYGFLFENALCDSGVVEINGHTYLVSVLSQLPEGQDEAVEELIVALFSAAASL